MNKQEEKFLKSDNEKLLHWLQEFYATKIDDTNFLTTINDAEIDPYNTFEKITSNPGVLKIYNLSNPGWNLEFYSKDSLLENNPLLNISINIGINLIDQDSNDWFLSKKYQKNFYNSSGGALYLSVCLESLRCFIEKDKFALIEGTNADLINFRKLLKKDNPLLCWLEEFYHSCCDTDWEHMYGYSLISVREGWLMTLSVEELYYEDKPFKGIVIEEKEGKVECYMLRSQFIIRAHFRGLITGIKVFKEWIESQPKYEDKRKEV